jgi:hypothetical protein
MDRLAETGKPVKVLIHVMCGPCRSPRRGSPVSFAPWFNITQLNEAILKDARTQRRYKKRVRKVRKRFLEPYPAELYPQFTFIIVPELEDNHKGKSFKAFYRLTKQVLRTIDETVNYEIVRNRSFLSTAHRGKPYGVENHGNTMDRLRRLKPGDRLSLDGAPFYFPGESCRFSNAISYEQTRELILEARRLGVDIELWRPEHQGLKCNAQHGGDRDKRGYRFPYTKLLGRLLK